ncbi:MAG TPA: OsmC family protein [Candidatus Eisenbacteria bacterium]|nr:OsmC family protein [Candidatus Eisenbacteria bacterium]
MVRIDLVYEGNLRCRLTHGPSGRALETDAPKDNQGKGESFSPTDLLASALGSCMMTVMGIYARKHGLPLDGSTLEITKEMAADPRRVSRLTLNFRMAAGIGVSHRAALEKAALTCPVALSLHPGVETPARFDYPD